MEIISAENLREKLIAMLSDEKLPVEDLPPNLEDFLVAIENEEIIGVAGMEIYSGYGLLRSVAVRLDYRKQGIAAILTGQIENLAKLKKLKELYLLTETARAYFAGKNFLQITRDDVPQEVKQSSQFKHVCPSTAVVMKKPII